MRGQAPRYLAEGELADRSGEAEERYQVLAKKSWNASDLGTRRTMYFSELLPLFAETSDQLQDVIGVNEVNAARLARQVTSREC